MLQPALLLIPFLVCHSPQFILLPLQATDVLDGQAILIDDRGIQITDRRVRHGYNYKAICIMMYRLQS